MNVYKCDACGDEYTPKKDGAGLFQLAILSPGESVPRDPSDNFLAQMLGQKGQPKEESYKFDLCYECALSMAVALKRQKADVRAGRRPV